MLTIEVFGITINEPTTLLTDYLLVLGSGVFCARLFNLYKTARQQSALLWSLAFLFAALSSFFGGTYHGLSLELSEDTLGFLWKGTVYSIGLVAFFIVWGTARSSVSLAVQKVIGVIISLQLVAYVVWMWSHDEFLFVILNYAPSLLTVLIMQAYAYIRLRSQSAKFFIAGVIISFLAAGVQMSRLSLSVYFNHNDLYHVIQLGGLYLLYRGSRMLGDRRS